MINRRQFVRGASALGAALAGGVPGAFAQGAWPTKPVRVINPFPAGGGTDVFLRPVAARLSQVLGQQFTVENLGGAGGTVGASTASKAPPDGYTMFCGAVQLRLARRIGHEQAILSAAHPFGEGKIMNAVIRERVTVDQRGAVVLVDARLHPGEQVEVTVRSLEKPAAMSFLDAARAVQIDAPEDYSVAFEDTLRPQA